MLNFSNFGLYVADTETTNLDENTGDIIELSLYRLNDDVQKTWHLKAVNLEAISQDALRINGHSFNDITHKTKLGQEKYQDPSKVIPEVENWIMDDGFSATERIIIGQNIVYDVRFLRELWKRGNSSETFPFGNRPFILDTMQLALLEDLFSGNKREFYNLKSLVSDYKVQKEKAHTAAGDVKMTKDVFLKQIEKFKLA